MLFVSIIYGVVLALWDKHVGKSGPVLHFSMCYLFKVYKAKDERESMFSDTWRENTTNPR